MTEAPFCCRCKEDFPVHTPDRSSLGKPFSMGQLFPLKDVPRRVLRKAGLEEWLHAEINANGAYLCGACYFDITETG